MAQAIYEGDMTMKRLASVRALSAVGFIAVAALAVACAPETPAGPPGTTASTTSSTTTTTFAFQQPTAGTWSGLNMTCSANVYGTYFPFSQYASVNVTAPSTVAPGAEFDMTVTPGPFIPPIQVSGYYLDNLVGTTIRFPLSPNMQVLDIGNSNSINAGTGTTTVVIEGTELVYRVPGPFIAGQEVQMPQVKLRVKATGAVGSAIEVRMNSLASVANVGIVAVPTYCTPPNPLIWTTIIAG